MALFPTNAAQVQAFAGALYGIQVGSTTMAQVNADIAAAGGLSNALNSYYAASFGSSTTAAVGATVAANLGLTGQAATDGAAYVTAALNAAPASARGTVIANVLNLFSNLSSDATYGAAATAWNTKMTAAVQYDGTTDAVIGSASATDKVFQLTDGSDTFTGGSGNDTFNARTDGYFAAGDILNGGAGNDSLFIRMDPADQTIDGSELTSIENIWIRADLASAGLTFDVDQNADITAVWVDRNAQSAGQALTITNTLETTTVGVFQGTGTGDVIVTKYNASTNTADNQKLALNDANIDAIDLANIETVTITTLGNTSSVANLTAATADVVTIDAASEVAFTAINVDEDAKITITGAGKVTITDIEDATTVNASGATGSVIIRHIDEASENYSITGGSGADTFESTGGTALGTADAINGGGGDDLLIVDTDVNTNAYVNITNIEKLQLVLGSAQAAGTTGTFDLSKLSSITELSVAKNTVASGTAATLEVDNFQSTLAIKLADNDVTILDVAGGTAAEATLNLTVEAENSDSAAALDAGTDFTLNTSDVTVINITSNDSSTADLATGSANDITISTSNDDVTAINVTATVATGIILEETSADLETISAAASTAGVTVTVSRSEAIAVTGGAGNDSVSFSASAANWNDDNTINGGAGTDSVGIALSASSIKPTLLNVETVNLTDAGTGNSTVDFNDSGTVATINVTVPSVSSTAGTDNTITLDNVQASTTKIILDASADATTAGTTLVVDLDTDTAADAMTFRLDLDGSSFAGITSGAANISAGDIEVVTLDSYLDTAAAASSGFTPMWGDLEFADATSVKFTLSLDATVGSEGSYATAGDSVLYVNSLDLKTTATATVDLTEWTVMHVGGLTSALAESAAATDALLAAALTAVAAVGSIVAADGLELTGADTVIVKLSDSRDDEQTIIDLGSTNVKQDKIEFVNLSSDSTNDIGLVIVSNFNGTASAVTNRTKLDLSAFDVADINELTITEGTAGIAIVSADEDFSGVIFLVGVTAATFDESNVIFTAA